jgi:putative ABC transport system permease protein
MVKFPRSVSSLDRKLVRDLWEMKSQALAIAAVLASGVSMLVTFLSTFQSLERTRDAFYESGRLADVFASLKRAPDSLEPRIRAIPGVESVMTRVVADVTLDIPGMAEPATGRLIGLPDEGHPVMNDVYLRRGRWVERNRPDEVLASEMFCEAHGFGPGDRVAAIINGRRRWLTIVGVALSAEYVYAVRPGEIFPERRRFGIFWMNGDALAAGFDMEGGFNDVSLRLSHGASEPDAIAALERLIEPYGGRGAVPRRLQLSAWALDNELMSLQMMGFILPMIFFSVAAFILNVALTRALALQRPQIAALKALGYSNRELAWHYIKWALFIAACGGVAGVAGGAGLGVAISTLYNDLFRFPFLDYRVSIDVAVVAMGVSMVVAGIGGLSAVRRAVRIAPAEAMRPEAPARYRRSLIERLMPNRLRHGYGGQGRSAEAPPSARARVIEARRTGGTATRMILRNLERQPIRSLVSVIGLAFAVAVLVVGFAFVDIINDFMDQQFNVAMRQDATVSFVEPRSARATHEVAHLPGVLDVEATRSVAVRLRSGSRERTLGITGVPSNSQLSRIVDRDGRELGVPAQGIVLSKILGDILGVAPGDTIRVEVLEGERPVRDVAVSALVDDSMGLQAYMHVDAVRQLLREGGTVTTAAVTLDPNATTRFYDRVKLVPLIAGVALREVALQNFRETMAANMNIQISLFVVFACIIAFGVVYNSARVSLSERSRELASLRVLGFTRAEISLILLGELAVLTVLALPIGAGIGSLLGQGMMVGLSNEVYRFAFLISPPTLALVFLIIIAATVLSGLVVRRRLDRLDLVAVLKTRE